MNLQADLTLNTLIKSGENQPDASMMLNISGHHCTLWPQSYHFSSSATMTVLM